jgi:hypothetical protein
MAHGRPAMAIWNRSGALAGDSVAPLLRRSSVIT